MPFTHRPPRAAASTPYNLRAAELMRSARVRTRSTQAEFAALLSEVLGYKVTPASMTYWERAAHTVPAAALLAAQSLSGQQIRSTRIEPRAVWRSIASRMNPKSE